MSAKSNSLGIKKVVLLWWSWRRNHVKRASCLRLVPCSWQYYMIHLLYTFWKKILVLNERKWPHTYLSLYCQAEECSNEKLSDLTKATWGAYSRVRSRSKLPAARSKHWNNAFSVDCGWMCEQLLMKLVITLKWPRPTVATDHADRGGGSLGLDHLGWVRITSLSHPRVHIPVT